MAYEATPSPTPREVIESNLRDARKALEHHDKLFAQHRQKAEEARIQCVACGGAIQALEKALAAMPEEAAPAASETA